MDKVRKLEISINKNTFNTKKPIILYKKPEQNPWFKKDRSSSANRSKTLSSAGQLTTKPTNNIEKNKDLNSIIEKLQNQLRISNSEIKNLKRDNNELKKLDNQSEAVKELDKMSRQFNDKTAKLILLQTTVDSLECTIDNQKQVTGSIRKKLDNTENQLTIEKTKNKVLSDQVAYSEQ